MSGVRILIADYNEAFRENLAELLGAHFTVQACSDGAAAKYLLDSFQPDILILDLMLPNADVFALLQDAQARTVEVYVFSSFLSAAVQDRLLTLGIYGIMSRNCDIYQAEYNIRALARRLPRIAQQRDVDQISALLLRMGFEPHRDGYKQLLLAIPMFARDPNQPMNKVIYSEIARHFGLTDQQPVERSIRDAIKLSCGHGDTALWDDLFPAEHRGKKGYPPNKQFISRICVYLRQNQNSR